MVMAEEMATAIADHMGELLEVAKSEMVNPVMVPDSLTIEMIMLEVKFSLVLIFPVKNSNNNGIRR